MKHTNKTLLTSILSLAIVLLFALKGIAGTAPADVKSGQQEAAESAYSLDMEMYMKPSIKPFIKDLTMLSEAEIKTLLDAEELTSPIYDKINALQQEIEAIDAGILEKNKEIFDKAEAIMAQHKELWDKVYDSIQGTEINLEDDRAMIKASKLSDEEKKTLLAAEDELDKNEIEINKVTDEIEAATKDLYEQVKKLYAEIDAINAKNKAIFDKIHDANLNIEGLENIGVPYSEMMDTNG